MTNDRKKLALTCGEPAGIGPELIVKLAQQQFLCELVVIGCPQLLEQRAKLLGIPLQLREYSPHCKGFQHKPGVLPVYPVPLKILSTPGQLDPANVPAVLLSLQKAFEKCLEHEFAAIVTGPVHKGIINQAGIPFTGQTEFFATLCRKSPRSLRSRPPLQKGVVFTPFEKGGRRAPASRGDFFTPVMLLANQTLRVALVTTHLPLSEVPAHITKNAIQETVQIVDHDLQQRFGIAQPRIAVCGLNPHAGENGYLGREEIDIIIPALEELRAAGLQIRGPLPADTAFLPQQLSQCDVVVAMYHDQGLPVLKAQGIEQGVNITLGLPIIRTSVDHGTALELAGTGRASEESFIAAIEWAVKLAENQQLTQNTFFADQRVFQSKTPHNLLEQSDDELYRNKE